ncbi:AfsR/SARP family transcriptional regulator [Actinophytocola xanthii]|uniref:OmpR/PhoB-type domain-containing protein n=1 Tax=Actinophytocola xanthii TaxID=1912961 RepID=A0A1Q8CL21_9PSEU|nr:BTAD domain-containing putative transcriptional regulator [Actinophytocola xanthii]OLF15057.1 hypothetical protein BU204_23565 [Actinophytocola xanthii]
MAICSGERVWAVGPPQRCAVLAALVVDADRVVPVDTVVERVWGERPPPHARRTLHSHLTRLRRLLEQAGATVPLPYHSGGYSAGVDPDDVDLHRFDRLVDRARTCEPADHHRLLLLREALTVWRGEPFCGVPGAWAERVREAWRRRHLDAVVAWSAAELCAGGPDLVIHRLRRLTVDHPTAESAAAVLMRALATAGRLAEALGCYVTVRERLAEEFGVDPGAELRRAHEEVLRADRRGVVTGPGG